MKYRHIQKKGKGEGKRMEEKRDERFQPTTAYITVVPLEENGRESFLQLSDVFVSPKECYVFTYVVTMFGMCVNFLLFRYYNPCLSILHND